uniref:Uncharacterized protein n=1 Tax=Streptomyces sp. NBC_01401 TaxID=2903854 RepID=A0AAU3GY83_9ACTN
MKAKSDKADWGGVNAGVTKPFISKTAKEFEDAAAEAKDIKLLLADAHTSFKTAKDELVRIRDEEAGQAGILISVAGKVTPRYDLEQDVGARNDPDYPAALQKQKAAVIAWQKRIDRLVEDCSDADDSLKRALLANVQSDKDFSAPKYSSLDAEQIAGRHYRICPGSREEGFHGRGAQGFAGRLRAGRTRHEEICCRCRRDSRKGGGPRPPAVRRLQGVGLHRGGRGALHRARHDR